MHSCYETASVADSIAMIDAMAAYFGSTLVLSEEGFKLS